MNWGKTDRGRDIQGSSRPRLHEGRLFSDLEYQGKKRKTRRELFLDRMDGLIPGLIPWQKLEGHIHPCFTQDRTGTTSLPIAGHAVHSLRATVLHPQRPSMKDLLYESDPVRRFVGLKLTGPLPDETTILNFRNLLENHHLGRGLLEELNAYLESHGLNLRQGTIVEGTIVDATIIEAPWSTKNRNKERDPQMHQSRKGNQGHFGMKAHIGVDSGTGIVHSLSRTARGWGGAMRVPGRGQAGGEPGPGGRGWWRSVLGSGGSWSRRAMRRRGRRQRRR